MAKIKARGATEVARWRKPGGAELVLTSDGRLLQKWTRGASWSLLKRQQTRQTGGAHAAVLGYEAV